MLATYQDLKEAISSYLDVDNLSTRVQIFISLAEARHKREIRIREMLKRMDLEIKDRFTDLPSDYLDLKHLRLRSPYEGGARYVSDFRQVNLDALTEVSTNRRRLPCRFTVHDAIEIDCVPDQEYIADLHYYSEIEVLSEDNESNALLLRASDVYLYGSLLQSAPFLLNDERIPVWEGLYEKARDTLNASEREAKLGGPLIPKVY